MTLVELTKELKKAKIPVSYSHFTREVKPPYLVYVVDGKGTFLADNRAYAKAKGIRLELYSKKQDFDLEEKIEDILDECELIWEYDSTYESSSKLHIAYYYFFI